MRFSIWQNVASGAAALVVDADAEDAEGFAMMGLSKVAEEDFDDNTKGDAEGRDWFIAWCGAQLPGEPLTIEDADQEKMAVKLLRTLGENDR